MSQVRFIADLHFGHENMAIKRGFSGADEQDEHIIKMWNSVVHKNDTTYIVGDVTMEKRNYSILDRLKGSKIIILGNHDMPNHVPDLLQHVTKVAGMMKKKFHKERVTAFLTHCPIHPMELDNRVGINIHGHIHEHIVMQNEDNWGEVIIKPDPRYICVSCEQIDYTPKLISELI
tara:strand:+ start:338 stop:862 length:525 start_codon:yes stop_codon:yes gene_type:complete